MHYTSDELSIEQLQQAEREALTRPSNSAMWDDRLYGTHAPVISWAERGDDLLAESNYLCVLEHLQAVAVWEDRDNQETADEYVIDATISDWLVGSLRQVFVQVRDEDGAYTHVFREAVAIALELRDCYPVFNESDYSEREWAAYEVALEDAIDSAAAKLALDRYVDSDAELYDTDDSEELQGRIKERTYELVSDLGQWCRSEEVDYDEVIELYRQARAELLQARPAGARL